MMMPVLLAPSSQRDLERLVEMRSTRATRLPLRLSTTFGKEKLGLFAPISGKRCKHSTKRLSWVAISD